MDYNKYIFYIFFLFISQNLFYKSLFSFHFKISPVSYSVTTE